MQHTRTLAADLSKRTVLADARYSVIVSTWPAVGGIVKGQKASDWELMGVGKNFVVINGDESTFLTLTSFEAASVKR